MAIITLSKLCKVYNPDTIPVHALKDITMSVEKAEFTAIVGPSGSGKSTLLNIIGGLDDPTSGTVTVAGQDISRLSDKERIHFRLHHIGFVFQAYNLIPVLTAKENVAFVLQMQGVSTKAAMKRSAEMLTEVGLEKEIDRRPSQLSGGQQQRVAVARALISNPDFILADEPTANLDAESASGLLNMMEAMQAQKGVTFLFSTHDQRVIDRAHRIVTLQDGQLIS